MNNSETRKWVCQTPRIFEDIQTSFLLIKNKDRVLLDFDITDDGIRMDYDRQTCKKSFRP